MQIDLSFYSAHFRSYKVILTNDMNTMLSALARHLVIYNLHCTNLSPSRVPRLIHLLPVNIPYQNKHLVIDKFKPFVTLNFIITRYCNDNILKALIESRKS